MTAPITVRPKHTLTAKRWDGSSKGAYAIFDWVDDRTGLAYSSRGDGVDTIGVVCIGLTDATMHPGHWLVHLGGNEFTALNPEAFDALFSK